MDLEGRTAVVTGGAMGIGLATVKRLLAGGCMVTIWDRDEAALAAARAELEGIGPGLFTYVCDVTDRKRVYELAYTAVADMAHVDILVNNAGYLAGGNFLDQPDDKWERTIAVNVNALLYTTRAFLPGMIERDFGRIVNISSAGGVLGVGGLSVYSASKWAVWGLTESLRHEMINLGKRGVKFSSIHPYYVKTGMFEGAKIRGVGALLVPLVKNHDVIARAIVKGAIRRGRRCPKRPRTIRLVVFFRGILPDAAFNALLRFLGIQSSMANWHGRQDSSAAQPVSIRGGSKRSAAPGSAGQDSSAAKGAAAASSPSSSASSASTTGSSAAAKSRRKA